VVRPRRRRTIAGSVRSELLGPVGRRRWRVRRGFRKGRRRGVGRRWRDVFRGCRRGRFGRCGRGFGGWESRSRGLFAMALAVTISTARTVTRWSPVTAADHRGRRRRVGSRGHFWTWLRLLSVVFRHRLCRWFGRLPRSLHCGSRNGPPGFGDDRLRSRQADVGPQRWRLRRAQQSRQQTQCDQADEDDRRRPRDPAPSDPHARHPSPRDGPPRTLPPQPLAARAVSMSASWSSTQSPGLRPKTISRRPRAHSAFCSGSIVRAR
jgi:hypothetical protein